jgi:hypothetical protein
MKTDIRIALAVLALLASASARADTVPTGAQRVANMIQWMDEIILAPLPVTVPEGWVFVLTDFDGNAQAQIFSAEDTEHPKWIGQGRSWQSGLEFRSAPLISARGNPFSNFLEFPVICSQSSRPRSPSAGG